MRKSSFESFRCGKVIASHFYASSLDYWTAYTAYRYTFSKRSDIGDMARIIFTGIRQSLSAKASSTIAALPPTDIAKSL